MEAVGVLLGQERQEQQQGRLGVWRDPVVRQDQAADAQEF